MSHKNLALAVSLVLWCSAARAGEISFSSSFTGGDLAGLSDALGDAIAFPTAGPASPLGVTGFDLEVGVGGMQVDTGSGWWRSAVTGSTVAGTLPAPRVLLRKGLPLRLDVGGQVGEVLGERFWGLEARYALLKGGAIEPAAGVRLSYSRLENAPFRLETSEVQFVVSKGFAVVTPYGALGFRRVASDATVGTPVPTTFRVRRERATGTAGLRVALLPFHVVAELRQGAHLGYFVGIGLGL